MHWLLPCIAQKFTTCGINTPIPLGCPWVGMNPKLGLLVGSISNPRVGGERFVCKQRVKCCKLAPESGSVQKERVDIRPVNDIPIGPPQETPAHPPLRVSWALSHPLCGRMAPPAGGPGVSARGSARAAPGVH